MHWKKSSAALIERFSRALPDDPEVQRRSMFGYPCAFVSGNMFCGLHEERLFVRLGESERRRLLREPGACPFEPMPGRRMTEYVVVPDPLGNRNLAKWLSAALRYAASLPPKPQRRRAKSG
jgi:TfoX/Sxy family transcriptional regulator of competence genes